MRTYSLVLLLLSACATASDDEPNPSEPGISTGVDTERLDPSSSGPDTEVPETTGQGGSGSAEPSDGSAGSEAASSSPDPSEGSASSSTSGRSEGEDTGTNTDGSSVECTELADCCNQIGADLYMGCSTVVEMGGADLCDSILSSYLQQGYCTGETFCADLGDCCSELPPGVGWQDTCEYYTDLGNQPQCAMLIGDYQLSGYCQ